MLDVLLPPISNFFALALGDESADSGGLRTAAQPRLLVVDDDAAIRKLVSTFLVRCGYEVELAEDGEEAIESLREGSYDAVITDLMMPRVDGIGVVNFIARERPALLAKTIVLTAYPELGHRVPIEAACTVVAKPFDLDGLRQLLRRLVG